MNESTAGDPKRARWLALWRTLHSVRFDPLPAAEDVARLLDALPSRLPGEPLAHWLSRAKPAGVVLSFPFARPRFTPLVTIERLAASSGPEEFPLPEEPMLSPDEAFRLSVAKIGTELELRLEALGADAFEHAQCCMGISAHEGLDGLVAFLYLDAMGNGVTRVADSDALRKALARPVLGLLEPPHE